VNDNVLTDIYLWESNTSGTWRVDSIILPDDFGYIVSYGDYSESNSAACLSGLKVISHIEEVSDLSTKEYIDYKYKVTKEHTIPNSTIDTEFFNSLY
jgi:hypothetical protein